VIGRTLGRYRIAAKLGQGGLATVWKARDELLGRSVALKILNDSLASQESARRRFLHEARTGSMLDHPGIVAVFDAGEAEGLVYIALAFIDGCTVSELAARRLMPIPEAVRIASAAAEALGYAHSRGVVHRDVTARNVMVARDGRVYVLDFGLALGLGTSRLTTSGTTMGTVAYMAPEVARGEEADARSDLYGLGVVLYEALTGAFPFAGERPEAMIWAALNEPPTPPRVRRPEIPVALERIVLRAIARDPARRYPTAGEMLSELRTLGAPPAEAGAPAASETAAAVAGGEAGATQPLVLRTRPDPLYLAVLPFECSSSEPDSDGVVESLTSRLPATLGAALAGSGVRVIAAPRSPAERDTDPRTLARELGANAVLGGRVARAGSQIRVTWSVLEPASGEQIAGAVVDGSAFQTFELEDQVVTSLTRALDLAPAPTPAIPGSRPRDPAASERFAQARGYLKRYDNEASVDGAVALLEQLMASEGESAALQATLARAYLLKHQLTRERMWEARAAAACERARRLDPDAPEVLLALGDLQQTAGRYPEAEAEYRRVLERQPELIEARLGLAGVHTSTGKLQDAEEDCRLAIASQPEDWRGYSRLGYLYFTRGQYEQALAPWGRVVTLTPDNARGRRNLGNLFYHLDRPEEAVTAYRESLAIHPNGVAFMNLGTALFYLSRYDEAAVAFRKATDLTPSDPLAWGNLGNAYHWMPGHEAESDTALDRAIALMRERLERNAAEADSWARLAGWLANRGCAPQASEAIRKALALTPESVDCMVRAGHVFFQLGDRNESLRWLREAVRRGYGVEELRRDPELAPLREDPEFERILMEGPARAGTSRQVKLQQGGAA